MIRRGMDAKLDPKDCMDADLRKKVFREMGGDFTRSLREGFVTDGPGKIAALMEKAFRMGAELASRDDFSLTRKDTHRDITDMDVPPAPRNSMNSMRTWLGVDWFSETYHHNPREIESCQLGFIMRPRAPGVPSSLSKDDWMMGSPFGGSDRDMKTYSNKSILPLVKLGLMAQPRNLGGGWRATYLTEWGFELLVTGRTSGPDSRPEGKSSTYRFYRKLLGAGDGPMAEAAYSLDLLERPSNAEPKA